MPLIDGASIAFTVNNANKRSAVLDPNNAVDRARLTELASAADIVVDGGNPAGAAPYGTSCAALAEQFGHLVALSVTDFGSAGPYASRRATDAVLYAMSTALSRTGPTAGRPVLPPEGVASGTAAAQGAWAALVAYYHRLRDGRGDYIDFSRYEAVLQSLDPPYGAEGQAAVGIKRSSELWRGRPRNQNIYPIFSCKDGNVRICLLSARQWRGMRGWLGEPEQFADPKFDSIAARYAASRELNAAIADLFAPQTMDALVAEGQARGVPVAAVLTAAETLASDHFWAVGAPTSTRLSPSATLAIPAGPFVVDGHHAGLVHPAPAAGADEPAWTTPPSAAEITTQDAVTRPFEGLRILDLGVIVAGGELGRLFADLGAEVIKIESAAYPDGLRQTAPGMSMSRSWALTHATNTASVWTCGIPTALRFSGDWSQTPMPCSPTSNRERLPRWAFHMSSYVESIPESCWPKAVRTARRGRGASGWVTDRWSVPRRASRGCGPRRTPSPAVSTTRPRYFPTTSPPGSPRSPRWRR